MAFKVGDAVTHNGLGNVSLTKGRRYIVAQIEEAPGKRNGSGDYDQLLYLSGHTYPNYGYASNYFEPKPALSLEVQLMAAEAAVKDFKAKIAERDAPKVGDRYEKLNDKEVVWEIVAINLATREAAWILIKGPASGKQQGWAPFATWKQYKKL